MQAKLSAMQGFTLLESLVTLLIIAGALLGTAGLQAYAIKVTQGSQFRTQAVILGLDILERLEANNDGAIAGNYAATLPASLAAADCNLSACTAAQMATYDLQEFQGKLAALLPDASASITFSGTGPYTYTVQINWKERSFKSKTTASSSSGQTENFSYTVSRMVYNRSVVI